MSEKGFEHLNVDTTPAMGTYFPPSDKRLWCFNILRNAVHHLPQNDFYNRYSTVRRAGVMSMFYLHSLKAAFLCQNSLVREGKQTF